MSRCVGELLSQRVQDGLEVGKVMVGSVLMGLLSCFKGSLRTRRHLSPPAVLSILSGEWLLPSSWTS